MFKAWTDVRCVYDIAALIAFIDVLLKALPARPPGHVDDLNQLDGTIDFVP